MLGYGGWPGNCLVQHTNEFPVAAIRAARRGCELFSMTGNRASTEVNRYMEATR